MTNETMHSVPDVPEPIVPAVEPSVPTVPRATAGGGLDEFFAAIRRTGLVRTQDRWCAGVASGIAHRMGWDPTLVRGVLFISTFLTGLGLVLYGLGWALLPEESDGRIHLQEALRGRFDVALLGAALVLLAGLNRNNVGFGHWFSVVSNVVTTGLLVVGAVYVVRLVRERRGVAAPTSDFPLSVNAGVTPMETVSPRIATAVLPAEDDVIDGDTLAASITGEPATAASTATFDAAPIDSVDAQIAAAKLAAKQAAHSAKLEAKAAAHQARRQARANTPIVRGPGARLTGAVLGVLMLLAAGAMALGHFQIAVPGPLGSPLAWLGAGLVVVGGSVAVSGLRGRRGGLLNLLGLLGLLALPAVGVDMVQVSDQAAAPRTEIVVPTFGRRGGGTSANVDNATVVRDGVVTVTDRAEAEQGFRARVGDPVIDLTGLALPTSGADPITVPISLQAGDLTVIVPDDAAVSANIRLLAGEVNWEVDDDANTFSQVGRRRTTLNSEEVGQGRPALELVIDMGAGNLTVRESE